jgi:diaminopimelate decarboxylase
MTKAICKFMQKKNFGLDCVSTGELFTAYSSGFNMQNIVYNGNNKTKNDIYDAVDMGISLFSVDNFLEAKNLNTVCSEKNIKMNILLRITPGIECHTHEYIQTGQTDSKFGFDLLQIDAIVSLIKNEYKNLNLIGLHAHLGSQIFEKKVYSDAIEVLMKEAKRINDKFGFSLNTFNIGGGAGIKYVESDKPISIFEIAEMMKKSFKENSEKYQINSPHVYIEPGRCIVGTSGITVYTVGSSKQVPNGKKYISVDGGMADNIRPALYDAEYTADKVISNENDKTETITIAGRYCESGDVLIKDIELPTLKEGDLICLYDTGAYCYTMSSNYNRTLKPAIILVKDGKAEIMVKRQTLDDIVCLDEIPEMLQ